MILSRASFAMPMASSTLAERVFTSSTVCWWAFSIRAAISSAFRMVSAASDLAPWAASSAFLEAARDVLPAASAAFLASAEAFAAEAADSPALRARPSACFTSLCSVCVAAVMALSPAVSAIFAFFCTSLAVSMPVPVVASDLSPAALTLSATLPVNLEAASMASSAAMAAVSAFLSSSSVER